MDPNEKKKIIIEVAAGVVVLIVVVMLVVYALQKNGNSGSPSTQSVTSSHSAGTGPGFNGAGLPSSAPTVASVPSNTSVPNKGASSTPSNVAVPVAQGPGNPQGTTSYRSFNISIDAGAYSPNTVIVKQGDTVNLELTAVDANYAFTLPQYYFNDPIAKGRTQTIQFEALKIGDFTFYCASCGGPSKGPVGHLIVTAN